MQKIPKIFPFQLKLLQFFFQMFQIIFHLGKNSVRNTIYVRLNLLIEWTR